MIKFILKISPLILLLTLQGCSKEYCCDIPGSDAIAGACSDGVSTDQAACEAAGWCDASWYDNQWDCEAWGYTWNGGTWSDGTAAISGSNECYSDQEECEDNCSHNTNNDEADDLGDGNCQEGK